MEDPEHRFLFYLFDKHGILPDDSWHDEIDPFLRLWLYESWVHEQELEMKRNRALGILIGSFTDPEAAQKMIKHEQPDFVASEEDHEETFRQIHEDALKQHNKKGRRSRRRKKKREVITE